MHVLGDDGAVIFTSSLFDPVQFQLLCCYLFLYEPTLESTILVAASGDPSPVGGTFVLYDPIERPDAFTSGGDVVFKADLADTTADHGIFVFDRQSREIRALVLSGAPAPFGFGLYQTVFKGSVSGKRLVFRAFLEGTGIDDGLFLIEDLTIPSAPVAVVFEGQATGLEMGGTFGLNNAPGLRRPFGVYSQRSDGSMIFNSRLLGALVNGENSESGIFRWNRGSFEKVVALRDKVPGGVLAGSQNLNFRANDRGVVVYFAGSIE